MPFALAWLAVGLPALHIYEVRVAKSEHGYKSLRVANKATNRQGPKANLPYAIGSI
jgi:hypothetical protein